MGSVWLVMSIKIKFDYIRLDLVRLCWVNEFENSDEKSQNYAVEMSIG